MSPRPAAAPSRVEETEIGRPRFAEVTEEAIRLLVDRFYRKVRSDPDLGPVFERAIAAEAWEPHLATMRDFWASVMLTAGRYKGNPLAAHARVQGIRPELFQRWLELFTETADELFEAEVAAIFRMKAGRIAQSLSIGLFYRPELGRGVAG